MDFKPDYERLAERLQAQGTDVNAVKAKLKEQGAEPVGNTPEEFGAFIKQQIAKWAKVLKEAGAKAE